MFRCFILFSALFVATLGEATAKVVLLSKDQPNSSGVSIAAGGWQQNVHTDDTYREFKKVHTGPFGKYDFYYRLEVVPQFKIRFPECSNNPTFASYFKALFGVSQGALVTVKASIQQRWASGNSVNLLSTDALLALAAIGASSESATAGNGCFFDQTARPDFPWIQWNGGDASDDFDDFQVKISVIGGKAKTLNAVSNVVSLFDSVSAAAGWDYVTSGLATPAAQAAQKAATNFQSALKEAGTLKNQVSKTYVVKSYFNEGDDNQGRLVITIPGLFGGDDANGNLAIYVRRQASIALQGTGSITPDSIFDTASLAYRSCSITQIVSGKCSSDDNPTIRTVLAKALKNVKDSGLNDGNPIQLLIDPEGTPKGVYNMCKGIRTVARLQLHLSTLDEMAVRWAFSKEGGLLKAFANAKSDADKKKKLEDDTGHSLSELENMCWNADDQKVLSTVAQKVGRPLQP